MKLCARGMEFEGEGKKEDAQRLYQKAWDEAVDDVEKFTSAHYLARCQENTAAKLNWDKKALHFALKIHDENIKATYPSLYLNIASCYEDLKDVERAWENYELALSFTSFLEDDGYGKMIKGGIRNGMDRVKKQNLDEK